LNYPCINLSDLDAFALFLPAVFFEGLGKRIIFAVSFKTPLFHVPKNVRKKNIPNSQK